MTFSSTCDVLVSGRSFDIVEVALAWTVSRENGAACGPGVDPTRDVNGDGCSDVADLQVVAANLTEEPSNVGPDVALRPQRLQAQALTLVVNSTADDGDSSYGDGICRTASGACTLRAAIVEANLSPGPDTITFNIPGSSVKTISLTRALPTLSDETGPTTIDGYTQPGAAANTDPVVSNAAIKIEITGDASMTALYITSPGNVVRGLAFVGLKRPILIYGSGAHDNRIVGTFVGTNAAGTYVAPNWISGGSGIAIAQGASRNAVRGTAPSARPLGPRRREIRQIPRNAIGGTAPADRNVISGNAENGIVLYDETTDNNRIINYIIGLSPAGDRGLMNRAHGLDINSHASYNIIGGTGPGERNVISGNRYGEGAEISHGWPRTTSAAP